MSEDFTKLCLEIIDFPVIEHYEQDTCIICGAKKIAPALLAHIEALRIAREALSFYGDNDLFKTARSEGALAREALTEIDAILEGEKG